MATASNGAITRLAQEFAKLPGIGPKSAVHLPRYLRSTGRGQLVSLAECFNLTEGGICTIPADPRRAASLNCVVEPPDRTARKHAGTMQAGHVEEIMRATSSPLEGATRRKRGLPSGFVPRVANNSMPADALEGRRTFGS